MTVPDPATPYVGFVTALSERSIASVNEFGESEAHADAVSGLLTP